jgi:hypothetical protein
MLSIQELLPHIEILESDERLAVTPDPRPFSVVAVGSASHDAEDRRIASARLIRVAWASMTCAERSQAVLGSESILVGPGEDLEEARLAFGVERAGELLEAHPAGTVALIEGPLPSLDAASETLTNVLLEALNRAKASGSTLLGYVSHPCPALFEGWIRSGERTPWIRSNALQFCYVNVSGTILRLEAYEIAPEQHDRVVAIAVAQIQKGFPGVARGAEAPAELLAGG